MSRFGKLEMKRLYRFVRATLITAGIFLVGYGILFLISSFVSNPANLEYWFGMFPMYIGGMMILLSFAMKEDWFTNARKYW